MKSPLMGLAIDLGVRAAIAFVGGLTFGLALLIRDGTLHDIAAHHAAAQTAGEATLFIFIFISAWWLPRMFQADSVESH
jgi:hypothetical protein